MIVVLRSFNCKKYIQADSKQTPKALIETVPVPEYGHWYMDGTRLTEDEKTKSFATLGAIDGNHYLDFIVKCGMQEG